jgi:hypothetical protein
MASAPIGGRYRTVGIFTGTKLLVFGGSQGVGANVTALGDGALYDPVLDSWTRLTPNDPNPPSPRAGHSTVWTGREAIVWGGLELVTPLPLADGALYAGALERWIPMTGQGAPEARYLHVAVWASDAMLIWGGGQPNAQLVDGGGRYNPVANRWTPIQTASAPAGRLGASAVWTGTELLVWGGTDGFGAFAEGGRYDPVLDSWRPMAIESEPTPRFNHAGLWTGSELWVWGGQDTLTTALGTGASYDPALDRWTPIPMQGAPSPRADFAAVVAGTAILVWGGGIAAVHESSGERYSLGDGTWSALPSTGAPSPRLEAVTVWSGSEMLVWGGFGLVGGSATASALGDGARYRP